MISAPGERAPEGPWRRTWVLALAIFLGVPGGLELSLRFLGHEPSVIEGPPLWAFHRARLRSPEPNSIVLIGMSRIKYGIDTEVFRKRYPDHEIVQLAIGGSGPVAALRDLAETEDFRGTVICSATAYSLDRATWDEQESYIRYYHSKFNLNARVNQGISAGLQDRLVILNARLNLKALVAGLLGVRPFPEPAYQRVRFDRSASIDYSRLDVPAFRRRRLEKFLEIHERRPPLTDADWSAAVGQIEEWIERIQGRGGRVVLVRFPTTEDQWAYEQQTYPRAKYWDTLAAATSAATVHFQDSPALSGIECPDYSHVDRRDKERFTSALLDELVRRKLLPDLAGKSRGGEQP